MIFLVILVISQEPPLFLARTFKVTIGTNNNDRQTDICVKFEHKNRDYLSSLPMLCLEFNSSCKFLNFAWAVTNSSI